MSKIFYCVHGSRVPSGGEKHSYEHVAILRAAGFEAFAYQLQGGEQHWFDGDVPVLRGQAFWGRFDPDRDYLVLSEPLGPMIGCFPGRKIIFNKNLYIGFRHFEQDAPSAHFCYGDPSVVAVLTVSEHNHRHLRFAFPHAAIHRVYAGIDPDLYHDRSLREKKRQIAIVNKGGDPLAALLQILRARSDAGLNLLRDYEVVVLESLSFRGAAAVLRDSLLLISLSTHEGLPRTVLEAMACGCLVAAYGTGPLREILPPAFAFEPDDLVGLATYIETVMASFPDHLDAWTGAIDAGRQTAAAFSPARQRAVVVDVWREILSRHDVLSGASS